MKNYTAIGLTVLAGLAVAAILAGATIWLQAVFSAIPVLSGLLGIMLALVALVTIIRARVRTPASRCPGKGLLLISLFLLLQLAYLPLARTLRDVEIRHTQEFLGSLVPKLEEYRQQHNVYPERIDEIVAADVTLPRLLQLRDSLPIDYDSRSFYFRRATTFGFQFYVPDGFIGFQYEYCCGVSGTWTVTD